jgi:hypothetical protein
MEENHNAVMMRAACCGYSFTWQTKLDQHTVGWSKFDQNTAGWSN